MWYDIGWILVVLALFILIFLIVWPIWLIGQDRKQEKKLKDLWVKNPRPDVSLVFKKRMEP